MQRREELILTRFVEHEGERIAVLVDARLDVSAARGAGSVFAKLQPAAIVQIGAEGARMYTGADAGRLCRRVLAQIGRPRAEPVEGGRSAAGS